MDTPNLIFIFSLPRSGSTWLQRVLSSHHSVATTAEPWLLLPILSVTKKHFGIQPYCQDYSYDGIKEALSKVDDLKDWKQNYYQAVRKMTDTIYTDLSNGRPFFLDKTPRYSLICDEIMQTYPDAKFIFLWRHPFSVVSSIQKTWGVNQWVLYAYSIDLTEGLFNLLYNYTKNKDRVYSINYEDFVDPKNEDFESLSDYLGLRIDKDLIFKASRNKINGVMGDPNQHLVYGGMPNSDWKKAGELFCQNKFRIHWLKRYSEYIGPERFSQMGYNYQESFEALSSYKAKKTGYDELIYSNIMCLKRKMIRVLSKNKVNRESLY